MAEGKRRAIDSALARPTAIVVVGQVPPHPSFWDWLPDELVELILSKLDGVTLWKGTVEQINRRLRDILRTSPVIQRAKFAERWDGYAIGRLRPLALPGDVPQSYGNHDNVLAVGQHIGKVKVCAGVGGSIHVWSGTPLRKSYDQLTIHSIITAIAMNNTNGNVYIGGWWRSEIEVRSGEDGTLLSTLVGHTKGVHAIAVGSGGEKVYSGSRDDTVRVWDGNTGNHLYTLEGHEDTVISLAIGGGKVYSTSDDWMIKVWSESDGNHLHTINPNKWISSIAFSPVNNRLYGYVWNSNHISVWSAVDYSELQFLEGDLINGASIEVDHTGNVYATAQSPHEGHSAIFVWKRGENSAFLVLDNNLPRNVAIAVGPDNKLYSTDGQGGIRVW